TFHIYQRAPFHILEKSSGKRPKTVHGVKVGNNNHTERASHPAVTIQKWMDAMKEANKEKNLKRLDESISHLERIAAAMQSWIHPEDLETALDMVDTSKVETSTSSRKRKAPSSITSRASFKEYNAEEYEEGKSKTFMIQRQVSDLRNRIVETGGSASFTTVEVRIRWLHVIYPRLLKEGVFTNP